jgi:glycosyltransferase involved in cell wall biosynthesis
LVVNEALACGLHAVVSDTCGVASDVGHHRGVYICSTIVASIAGAMTASAQKWDGPIERPEILSMSTKHLAELSSDTAHRALHEKHGFRMKLRRVKAAMLAG